MKPKLHPTQPYERIGSLDFLRGLAILGILVINIESFSYPDPWSPFQYGFSSQADHTTRFWVYFLAQGKFFSMFTLLFGVGFYIFLERLEKRGLGLQALDLYARRLLWLFVFGLVHAYLIWDGDVLYHYAICGFLLFPFRSMSIRQMSLILLLLVSVLLYNASQTTLATQKQFIAYVQANRLAPGERSQKDDEIISNWENRTRHGTADTTHMEVPRQSLYQNWLANTEHTKVHKGVILYSGILFRTLIMMILGIMLYKSGIFQDYRSIKHYWLLTTLVLIGAFVMNYFRYHHWTFAYFKPVVNIWQSWLFTFPKETLGLGYILLFNGLYQKFHKRIPGKIISDTGKMALTNYILQSIICSLIFYGYGLGKYNDYSRKELLSIVAIIWIVQLTFSWFWMQKFSQGPLEKLWRMLTYQSAKKPK